MAWNNGQGYGPMKGVPNGKGGEGPYGQVPAGKEDMMAMVEQAPQTMPQPTETMALAGAQEQPNAGEAAAQQGEVPPEKPKSAYEMIPCVNVDKATLIRKLQELQKSSTDGRSKWWSFCKVHGEGKFDPREHDEALLQTFFEAYDAGEVPDEPGCPFAPGCAKGCKGCKGGFKGGGGGAAVDWSSPSTNKIFVGGMPKTVTEQYVREHFTQFGTVTGVELKYDPEGNFRSFGFVSFSDPASAQLVMSNVDNNNMEGKWIDCRFAESNKGKGGCGKSDMKGCLGKAASGKGGAAKGCGWGCGGDSWGGAAGGGKAKGPPAGPQDVPEKVFAGGMPKTATEETLRAFFSQFGEVANIDMKYDEMGLFKGFAFITYQSAESAQVAIANGANNTMEGRWIDVKPAVKGAGVGGKAGDKGGKAGGKPGGGWGGAAGWGGGAAWGAGDSWGAAKGAWGDDSASGKGGKGAAAGGWGGSW